MSFGMNTPPVLLLKLVTVYTCTMCVQVQTPLSDIVLADEERDAMSQLLKECCPVTKGLEAPDVCAKL